MSTLAQVTIARKVAQARWEQAQRVKEMAVAAERRYKALLYEFYAEEIHFGDKEHQPAVTGACLPGQGRHWGRAARERRPMIELIAATAAVAVATFQIVVLTAAILAAAVVVAVVYELVCQQDDELFGPE